MLIFSDVHLREETADVVLGEVLPGIAKAAEQYNEREIACLGDFWHLRYRVSVQLQNAVRDEFKRWTSAGLSVRILPGNHDQVDVHGRNAMEVFDTMPGVSVYTEPTWDKDGLWVPYRRAHEEIQKALSLPRPHGVKGPTVAFMHVGLRGAAMNNHVLDTEGVPEAVVQGFTMVLAGHYHKRQLLFAGRAAYIGSPWQTRADEAGQDKGFALWDGRELRYVNTLWGRRFHKFQILQPGQKLDLSNVRPHDEVRVATAAGVNPEAVGQQLVQAGIAHHSVTPDIEPLQTRLLVREGASLAEYAQAYVQNVPTDLDRGKLMAMFAELTS